MATDVEESDTDDHERPAPPKRQCTRVFKSEENAWESDKQDNKQEVKQDESTDPDHDELVKKDRERLKKWQACQVAKGYMDNTINTIMESFIIASASYPFGDYRFRLLKRNDMEDTAVTMAIRNHGLVHSADLVSRSHAFCSNKPPEYWTNKEHLDVQCSCPSNHLEEGTGISNFAATTSSNSSDFSEPDNTENCSGTDSNLNRTDDNYRQEDFLERAVAEAIKKKGLSALSVDYG